MAAFADPDRASGFLSQAEEAVLKAHLETCVSCQQRLQGTAADRDSWQGVARHLATPPPDPVCATSTPPPSAGPCMTSAPGGAMYTPRAKAAERAGPRLGYLPV